MAFYIIENDEQLNEFFEIGYDKVFIEPIYFNDFVSVSLVHECDHPIISGTSYISRYPYLADETKLFLTIGNERK